MKLTFVLFWIVALSGCSSETVSRGATLLSGLSQFSGEMQRVGSQPERWPDRQRAAGGLKTLIAGTLGASGEFYRLVDLDLRKREFHIAMGDSHLRADRLQEMTSELAQMDEEIVKLKPVVKNQLAAIAAQESAQRIDNIATLGLLGIALESFSAAGAASGFAAPSTKVGQYIVTDLGSASTVRAPDGQSFRCNLFSIADEGSGMRCEPAR